MSTGSLPIGASVLQGQLLQLLRQTLGSKVELVGYEIGNRRHDYLVLLARLSHPSIKVVIKLAGPKAPIECPFDRTVTLHHLVMAQTTIPMPEVLAADVSYQTWPWRYFIKRHIPGQEWAGIRQQMNERELSAAYQQIGDAVAQLHTIHFPAFGELAVDGSVRRGTPYITAL